MKDTWIVMPKALLDVLWEQAWGGESVPDDAKLLLQSVRGYWADIAPDEVINTSAPIAEVQAFMATHGLTEAYSWNFTPGTDSYDVFPTNPTRLLELMAAHLDESVEPPAVTPPTLDNPNWAHSFMGAGGRIFAGQFSNQFSEGFL